MSGVTRDIRSSPWLLLAVCAAGLLFGGAASADDRHRDDREHREHSHRDHDRRDNRHDDRRHDEHHDYRRHDQWNGSHREGHYDRRYSSRGNYERRNWHYYNGRYWAPPRYRGRECTDRRHYHGVHYHVVARDYYDYYYPRYRYYGSRPLSADASVIISIPLF